MSPVDRELSTGAKEGRLSLYRLFTLDEATDMIPTVEELLDEMQEAARDLSETRERLSREKAHSVAARNAGQEVSFLLSQLHAGKAELDRMGVQLKDFDSGTVEFPSQIGAEVVCLSWEKGQPGITHYHRLGESTPKPLPAGTLENPGTAG